MRSRVILTSASDGDGTPNEHPIAASRLSPTSWRARLNMGTAWATTARLAPAIFSGRPPAEASFTTESSGTLQVYSDDGVAVADSKRVLSGMEDVGNNFLDALTMLDLGKEEGTFSPHFS